MDTSGCPEGFAKDRLVTIQEGGCTLSTRLYLIVAGLLIILRFLMSVWISSKGISAWINTPSDQRRLPLGAMLDFVYAALLLLFYILSALMGDKFNSISGYSPGLILLLLFFTGVTGLLQILKFVHLGMKILPRKMRAPDEGEDSKAMQDWKADVILRFGILITILGLSGALLSSILIFSSSGNPSLTGQIAEVGLFCCALFVLGTMTTGARQMHRLVLHLDKMVKIRIGTESDEEMNKRNEGIKKVTKGLKKSSFFWLINLIQVVLFSGPLLGIFEYSFATAMVGTGSNILVTYFTSALVKRKKKQPKHEHGDSSAAAAAAVAGYKNVGGITPSTVRVEPSNS